MYKKSKIKSQKSKLTRRLALSLSKGFSLIELLIVVSIISILSVIGVASYINFSRSQTVTQAARKIVQDMRLAQSLANNNQKPEPNVCFNGCKTLDGYTFSLDNGSYTLFANCINPVENCAPIKLETLTGFTFDGFTTVKFKVLRRGVDFPGGKTLTVGAFGKEKKIIVDDGGSVMIEGETP